MKYTHVRYETPTERVARIVISRPEMANAQNYLMLSELNDAFDRAARDDAIRVIVLAADGRHFSSGHDLAEPTPDMMQLRIAGTTGRFDKPGAEGYMNREHEVYLGYCRRWRDIPKPTIAQVQGKVIAGGLMLMWPMDLIVCSEEATFCDPVVALGYNGVEYFAHPFELGGRMAKDMLFTGRALTAEEAFRVGMVQRVFPLERLEQETLDLAQRIAHREPFALAMAKRSVNFADDAKGLQQTLDATFAMHHVVHSHWQRVFGESAPPHVQEDVRMLLKERPMPGTAPTFDHP